MLLSSGALIENEFSKALVETPKGNAETNIQRDMQIEHFLRLNSEKVPTFGTFGWLFAPGRLALIFRCLKHNLPEKPKSLYYEQDVSRKG